MIYMMQHSPRGSFFFFFFLLLLGKNIRNYQEIDIMMKIEGIQTF